MEIIISSSYLYSKLSDIDFATESVCKMKVNNGQLKLILDNGRVIEMFVESRPKSGDFDQSEAAWSNVRNVCGSIVDQPINISPYAIKDVKNRIRMILWY